MTKNKRFRVFKYPDCKEFGVSDDVADCTLARFDYHFEAELLCEMLNELAEENEQLKSQLYYDEEEGVCNICKHHYLIKDDESEFGYYNSRCKKGHYECARVSLKYCEDFEKELKSE